MTKSQIMAAKLVVEMDLEDGNEPNPLAVKIANATPAPQPRDADGNLLWWVEEPEGD